MSWRKGTNSLVGLMLIYCQRVESLVINFREIWLKNPVSFKLCILNRGFVKTAAISWVLHV